MPEMPKIRSCYIHIARGCLWIGGSHFKCERGWVWTWGWQDSLTDDSHCPRCALSDSITAVGTGNRDCCVTNNEKSVERHHIDFCQSKNYQCRSMECHNVHVVHILLENELKVRNIGIV